MSRMLGATDDRRPGRNGKRSSRSTIATALLLGALLHDIGKIGDGGHVAIGARIATETLDAMGVERADAASSRSFMVEQHLLLPDTATRRDLTDENLILDVAATVGHARAAGCAVPARQGRRDRDRSGRVDAVAPHARPRTGRRRSSASSNAARWVRSSRSGSPNVVDRLRDLLADEPDADGRAVRAADAPRLLPGGGTCARPRGTSRRSRPPSARTRCGRRRAAACGPGTYELLVVAADRPGLLSWIAGALALAGLSILTAQVFTTDDGVAVDLFEVEGVFEREIDASERWREFRRTLRKAIEGRISLAASRRGEASPLPDARGCVTGHGHRGQRRLGTSPP